MLAGRKSNNHAYADLERTRTRAFSYFVMEKPDGSSVRESSETLPDSSWTVSRLRNYLKERGGRLSGEKCELLERYDTIFLFLVGINCSYLLSRRSTRNFKDVIPDKIEIYQK